MRLVVGLLLLPTAASALLAAAKAVGSIASHPRTTLDFLYGFFGYAALHFLFFKPLRLYVLAHELTHAAAAWMSGARVRRIHVGKEEGKVELDRSNAFIALAPYCVPLYALGVLLAYRAVLWKAGSPGMSVYAHGLFLSAMGAALAFHLLMTGDTLWGVRQPDLAQAGGVVFSLATIGLANSVVVILALKLLFPRLVEAGPRLVDILLGTLAFWELAGRLAVRLWDAIS